MNKRILGISMALILMSGISGCAQQGPPTVEEFRAQLEKTRTEIARLGKLVVKIDTRPIIACSCTTIAKPNVIKPVPGPPPPEKAFSLGMAAIQKLNDASEAGLTVEIVAAE